MQKILNVDDRILRMFRKPIQPASQTGPPPAKPLTGPTIIHDVENFEQMIDDHHLARKLDSVKPG